MPNPVFQLILTVAPFPTNFGGNLNDYATQLVSLISASLSGSILPGIYNPPNAPATYTSDQGPIFYQGQWYFWNASLPTPAYVLYAPATPATLLSPNILDNGDFQVVQRAPGSLSALNIGPDQWWTGGVTSWTLAGSSTVPAVGATRNIAVVSSTGAVAGQNFYPSNLVIFTTGDEMTISAVPDGTHITFQNTGGATPGNAITTGTIVRVRQKIYLADRFACSQDGTITTPPNQQITAASILGSRTTNNPNTTNCLRITANSSTVTPSSGQYVTVFQRIERQRLQLLFDIQPSLSIWLRCSLPGTFCVSLRNAGLDHSIVFPCNITSTGVWQTFAFNSLPTPPYGSGVWGTNPYDVGAVLSICIAAGSTYQQSPTNDQRWVSGNVLSDTNQVNLLGTALATLDICLAQLEPSPVATAFNYLDFPKSLAVCQRYCCKSYPYAVAPGTATGSIGGGSAVGIGTNNALGAVKFPREMRQTPQFMEFFQPDTGAYYSALQNLTIPTVFTGISGLDATGFNGLVSSANFASGNVYSVDYLAEDGLL